METETLETLKYPTGKLKLPKEFTYADIQHCIDVIGRFPKEIKEEVVPCTEEELAYLHRPEGWTIRQLTHHCADSHMNAFIRVKLALTEDKPTIKPYKEAECARLVDTTEAPVEWSLQLIEGLHKRWVLLLNSIKEEQLGRTVFHPEMKREIAISDICFIYSWHCGHHLAHIKNAKKHKNKF